MTAVLDHGPDEILVGFGRALRAAGVGVTPAATRSMLEAVALVGLDDQQATYWAARATLCAGPDDLAVFDRVFEGWFFGDQALRRAAQRPPATVVQAALDADGNDGGDGADDTRSLRVAASETEILRHRDIAAMTPAERARLAALFNDLAVRLPVRPAYRRTPWHRGDLDRPRTLRRMRRSMGEPVSVAWRHRSVRPRRVVLLIDVSGSMSAYADALLRLGHRITAAGRTQVEVFSVGTRLTRVSRALRLRDPQQAIAAAGDTVPDWSGGTRLGETMRAFLDRWGQRGMARGAVVVMFSDGWERGDASLLGDQMRRLSRLAHRVIWVNPHKGAAGYQPIQLGMAAALPYCDAFVAGHSLAAFAELMEVLADA